MKYFCKETILLVSVLFLGPVTYGPACDATISGAVSSEVIPVDFKHPLTPEERERKDKLKQEELEKKWEELTAEQKKGYLESLRDEIKKDPLVALTRMPPGAKPEEPNAVSDLMWGFGLGFIKIPKKLIQYFQGAEQESDLDAYGYALTELCVDPLCKETAAFQVRENRPETPAHHAGVVVGWITFLLVLGGAVKTYF